VVPRPIYRTAGSGPIGRSVDTPSASIRSASRINDDSGAAWTVSEDFEWSELEVDGDSPGTISRHAMEFVPGVGVLVFGGVYRGRPDVNDDLWVLDTRELRWHQR